jgi:ABC-2 type transport system permease protein
MKRALGYERMRATSIRSSWGFPAVGIGLTWALGLFITLSSSAGSDTMINSFIGQVYTPISALFLTIPFAQAFGHDYRDGTMRLTLSEFPNRMHVFVAKIAVPAVIAVIATVITTAGLAAILQLRPSYGYEQLPILIVRECLFTLMWGVIVASVTVLTRNMAAGIVGPIIWWLLVEQLIASLLSKFPIVLDLMPLNQGIFWAQFGEPRAGLVMLGATAIIAVAAYLRFTRSDS